MAAELSFIDFGSTPMGVEEILGAWYFHRQPEYQRRSANIFPYHRALDADKERRGGMTGRDIGPGQHPAC
jgi:hypothetical protein